MPLTTSPTTVYWPLRNGSRRANMMKNCELAEFGILRARHADRAAHEGLLGEFGRQVRQVGAAHAGCSARSLLMSPNCTSPVCAMKPSMTRWKTTLS